MLPASCLINSTAKLFVDTFMSGRVTKCCCGDLHVISNSAASSRAVTSARHNIDWQLLLFSIYLKILALA